MPTSLPNAYPGTPGETLRGGLPDPSGFTVPNELRMSSVSGTQTNYPYQFGRPFKLGVIPNFPQVLINGTPVTTQADVKTRHTDGSVKFAVISIVVPSLPTSETVLTFQNQVSPSTTAETIANMLADYDFEATIGIAVDGTPIADSPVSARAMLTALSDAGLAAETAAGGVDARYWTQGPICTTVLLHNHTDKTYDVGTNATKAIRPMFIVQFWPTISKYHVEHILEVADVTKVKDETNLDITFTVDNTSPVTKLTETNVAIYNGQVIRRQYWGGTDVPRCNAKHGVAFYADCKVQPNHDPSITINAASLTSYASDWAGKSKAIGANGYWNKNMAASAGRPDLGMCPKWDTVAWYSGDAGMMKVMEESAELFCSFNFFWREGNPAKTIFSSESGEGRILSKLSRPTLWLQPDNFYNAAVLEADEITLDGTIDLSPNDWALDNAHTPGVFWLPYLMTGGYFYYEKLLQMGAHSCFWVNPGLAYNGVGSGASAAHMIFQAQQVRAMAWQGRNRGRAWWAALDGSPEKDLLDQAMTDAIAQRAGVYNISGLLVGNSIRDAWNTNYATWHGAALSSPRPNALGHLSNAIDYPTGDITGGDPDDSAGGGSSLWQHYFNMLVYSHLGELGRAECKVFADWMAPLALEIANSAEPRHLADYAFPSVKTGGSWYQNVADIYDGWAHNADSTDPTKMPASSGSGFSGNSGTPNTFGVLIDSYGIIASAAIAMANGVSGQDTAWAVVEPWYENTLYIDHDPTYAIIPRAGA